VKIFLRDGSGEEAKKPFFTKGFPGLSVVNAIYLGLVPGRLDVGEVDVIADGAHRIEDDLASSGAELLVQRREDRRRRGQHGVHSLVMGHRRERDPLVTTDDVFGELSGTIAIHLGGKLARGEELPIRRSRVEY